MRKTILLPAVFIFLLPLIAPAQPSPLQVAIEKDDAPATERLLRELRRSSPASFAQNNHDYLLGRLLERRGANLEAKELFKQVVVRQSILAGYALWHLAEIARIEGDAAEEQEMLRRLLLQHPGHLRRDQVVRRLGDSYFRAKKYQEAIDALSRNGGPRRDSLVRIGEAQLALRQLDGARSTFESVLAGNSTDDSSLRAAQGLDRIETISIRALSETERLRRARVYQFNRYFAEARRHWQALARDFPQSTARAEALFQLGRGYFLENRFTEAIQWYTRVAREFPQTDEGEQGFYYVGHCYQGMDDAARAIARYEEFIQAYPRSTYVGYAHLNAIDTLRSAGRLDEALAWAARAQANLKEPFFVVTGLFNQAKIRLSQENYKAALADLTALKGRSLNVRGISATTNPAEVAYLRAYCLEKLGNYPEAVYEYLSLAEGRNGAAGYYGARATQRLRELGRNPRASKLVDEYRTRFLTAARAAHQRGDAAAAKTAAHQVLRFALDARVEGEMLAILRAAYGKLRGYQLPALNLAPVPRGTLAGELTALGLHDEGASELAATSVGTQTIAYYCARGDCADLTFKYSDPILNALPVDYRPELLPADWARLFYPMPYRDLFEKHAAPRGVDHLLLLSLARQESGYQARAMSNAAARGMLQFIAPTALDLAGELKLRDFELNDLFTAETAILLGSQYVKKLQMEFGSPAMVAAAYNGSEDSVRRWIARSRSRELDRHVIEILKRETKDYVFKVMSFYAAYRQVYREGN